MAGPAVPTNRDISSSIDDHTADHNLMALMVDKFDQATPSHGDVLQWNSGLGLYTPQSVAGAGGRQESIDARDYTINGNDSTDNTTALQSWVNDVVTAKACGYLPPASVAYAITSALVVPQGIGWGFKGASRESSIIRQHTNNTPHLDIGATGSSAVHSWKISDLQFDYSSVQSTAQTNAIPIKFSAMAYQGSVKRCNFKRGFYGMSVASSVVGLWGVTLDDLWFDSGITGGAISFASAAVNGVPNNHWGRILATATNMVGPIFSLKGETCKIDTIEILDAQQGPRLMDFASGDAWDIDQVKLEVGTYSSSLNGLFNFGVNASARIGYLRVHDLTVGGSAAVTLVNTQPQSNTDITPSVRIGKLDGRATFNSTAKGYGISAGSPVTVDEVHLYKLGGTSAGTWRLQDGAASDSADQIQVLGHNRQRVSGNLGNADYTIVHGVAGAIPSPNILFFETTFTAQRTVDLPSNIDDLWNGLTYTIIARNGAINSTNTLRIRVGSTILRTQTTDNYALTYTYRRQSSGTVDQNWKLTDVANLA